MKKTVLLTGATDGIGLELAKVLVADGHLVLLHGRNPEKLHAVQSLLSEATEDAETDCFVADLSDLKTVDKVAREIAEKHAEIDVLINNAGIFKTGSPKTRSGLDVRVAVNTLAPYLLMQRLLPLMGPKARVVNLSSAAQAPVDQAAFAGKSEMADDFAAYSQSKLALTMWSHAKGLEMKETGPVVVAVNPGSLLGTKMVKQGFGMAGNDIQIGTDILYRAAFSDEFKDAFGKYFDNDARQFAAPHPDACDLSVCEEMVRLVEETIVAELNDPSPAGQ